MKSDIFNIGDQKEAPVSKGKREAIQVNFTYKSKITDLKSHRDNDIFGVRERVTGVKQPYQEHDIVAAKKAE